MSKFKGFHPVKSQVLKGGASRVHMLQCKNSKKYVVCMVYKSVNGQGLTNANQQWVKAASEYKPVTKATAQKHWQTLTQA